VRRMILLTLNVSEVVFVILRRKCGDSGNLLSIFEEQNEIPVWAIGECTVGESPPGCVSPSRRTADPSAALRSVPRHAGAGGMTKLSVAALSSSQTS
jgi:hypothetical protein